ncbi:hypothetical protein [Pseudomonas helleri]|uniref:hypothetical protein n=1 Tax=Pseudomonas helleri TaxID=1608996 RepID=UPI003FD3C78F
MKNANLVILDQAGFKLPEVFGKSRHPLLDDNGQPRDPRTVGFEVCTTGGGNMALSLESDRFRIFITSDCDGNIPKIEEWETLLISVDVDAYEASGYDLITMTALEWKLMYASTCVGAGAQ